MPTGPQGQKRPADAIGLAVLVGKIATGECEEPACGGSNEVIRGRAGGIARATKLSADRRQQIAVGAAAERWR